MKEEEEEKKKRRKNEVGVFFPNVSSQWTSDLLINMVFCFSTKVSGGKNTPKHAGDCRRQTVINTQEKHAWV